MSTTKPNLYCVIFRTGGTVNFKWHRSAAMFRTEAERAVEAVHRMGYVAHVENYSMSMSIGLPETYAIGAGSGPLDPEDHYEFEDREEVRVQGRMSDGPEEIL